MAAAVGPSAGQPSGAGSKVALSDQLSLRSPEETRGWLVLKEGYLYKSKLAKGLLKSTKLRWFVLKQNPVSAEARLEYYEGMMFRGSSSLRGAHIGPTRKPGCFTIRTQQKAGESSDLARTLTLQVEKDAIAEATAWILALENAARVYQKARQTVDHGVTAAAAVLEPLSSPELPTTRSAAPDVSIGDESARRRQGSDVEVDGTAIDNARWAALRRRADEPEVCFEDDEDVIALRRLEEEEERRQEEERKAFLAEREAALQCKAGEISPLTAVVERELTLADETAEVSEDEEDWLEQMQRAEAEEAERQERERQEWLKQKGDPHTS